MENAEETLARRIQHERERRGWSFERLASAMNEAGVRIGGSALWKIENQRPRRTISLDEAMAFSKVFEMPLEQLLVPPELAADQELFRLVDQYGAQHVSAATAKADCANTARQIEWLLHDHPESVNRLIEFLEHAFPSNRRVLGDALQLMFFGDGPVYERWWLGFEMLFSAGVGPDGYKETDSGVVDAEHQEAT
jgi:transcriptional regulator with XRE-family HTH domain